MGETKRGKSKKAVEAEHAKLREQLASLIDRWVRSAKSSYGQADEIAARVAGMGRIEVRLLEAYRDQVEWNRTRGDELIARAHQLAKETGLIEACPDLLFYDAWLEEQRACWKAREGIAPHGLVQARRAA